LTRNWLYSGPGDQVEGHADTTWFKTC